MTHRRVSGLVAIGIWAAGCQLVDPPSDVTGGHRPNDEAGGGGAGVLCSFDSSGVAEHCPAGTEACCYTDLTGTGTCGTVASCASNAVFLCSGFADCPAPEICCAISMFVAFDGGDYNALAGASCTDLATCSANGVSAHVLCTLANDQCSSLGPAASSCQPWGAAAGGRYPLGYWSCQ
jgi:hypothetical protein